MLSGFLLLAGIACVASYTPEALLDQIKDLPGLKDKIAFNHFSGYLDIPGTGGNTKHIHYWLVESENNPSTDPLTFWTNGGPGCSGLIGFMTEQANSTAHPSQGPFQPKADNTLSLNEYAWNKVSNMVFIESPAGVGFSYADNKADLTTGDTQTALDNYNLIQALLVRYPEFAKSPVYLTSESYGGHYLPTLAKRIVDENTAGVNPTINFKGFAVGNPYTNVYSGTPAMIDTYWGHQLVPAPVYKEYAANCISNSKVSSSASCLRLEAQLLTSIGNLNSYALDYPVCVSSAEGSKETAKGNFGRAQRLWFLRNNLKARGFTNEHLKAFGLGDSAYEPCADDYTNTYLNTAAVKAAIHVKATTTWNSCSNTISYNSTDSNSVSTAPIYQYLINGGFGLDILVYSGDDDSVCATIGTQDWIWGLGYTVANQWQTYYVNGQTAGFLTQWKNTKLGFLTVHAAGHEVPTYVPEVALDLFTKYLAGSFTNV